MTANDIYSAYLNEEITMIQTATNVFTWLLGFEQTIGELTIVQIITRTIIVYGVALVLIDSENGGFWADLPHLIF